MRNSFGVGGCSWAMVDSVHLPPSNPSAWKFVEELSVPWAIEWDFCSHMWPHYCYKKQWLYDLTVVKTWLTWLRILQQFVQVQLSVMLRLDDFVLMLNTKRDADGFSKFSLVLCVILLSCEGAMYSVSNSLIVYSSIPHRNLILIRKEKCTWE